MARRQQKLPRSLSSPQSAAGRSGQPGKAGRQTGRKRGPLRRQLSVTRLLTSTTALIAIAIAITAVVAGFGESNSAARQRRIDSAVTKLFAGVPQKGNTLGAASAPVTLQIFGDLECHQARRWMIEYLPAIIEDFVRPGTLKIQYRSFKTDTIWPKIFISQETAALAAGAEGKMWNYLETFYQEQGVAYTRYATERYLDGIAAQIPGLNLHKWQQDRRDGRRSEMIAADDQAARTIGFHDTPGFLIGPSSGKLHVITGSKIIKLYGRKYPVSLLTAGDVEAAIGNIERS